MNFCNSTNVNFNYMKGKKRNFFLYTINYFLENCQQYCGDMGFSEGFNNCYIPRNYIVYPCKYLSDQFSNCPTLGAFCNQESVKSNSIIKIKILFYFSSN